MNQRQQKDERLHVSILQTYGIQFTSEFWLWAHKKHNIEFNTVERIYVGVNLCIIYV